MYSLFIDYTTCVIFASFHQGKEEIIFAFSLSFLFQSFFFLPPADLIIHSTTVSTVKDGFSMQSCFAPGMNLSSAFPFPAFFSMPSSSFTSSAATTSSCSPCMKSTGTFTPAIISFVFAFCASGLRIYHHVLYENISQSDGLNEDPHALYTTNILSFFVSDGSGLSTFFAISYMCS